MQTYIIFIDQTRSHKLEA